ncbi:hypothetical protein X805_05930 [Sphaerotilus natans subsp. natans DSM 6575]|uniref:Uncharacterized protein n=1 Tax=Sphaerotilus natans subsp. natans DSM 6575 TaxID=1286631 RepID=A0A059KRQ5_9BURK|nr:hypothetical protein X805_05930 [Sphaerotilus natans subsp. natans DSM 6575]
MPPPLRRSCQPVNPAHSGALSGTRSDIQAEMARFLLEICSGVIQ